MSAGAVRDMDVQLVTKRRGRINAGCQQYEQRTEPQTTTAMSTALKLAAETPLPEPPAPLRFSETELRLRSEFEAAFNDASRPGFDLNAAVWNVTDDLKREGQSAEYLVKRIKYIAAIPNAFRYRVGYKAAQLSLKDAVEHAVSLAIARYFPDEGG